MENRINERLDEMRPKPAKTYFLHAFNRAGARGTKSHSLGHFGTGTGGNQGWGSQVLPKDAVKHPAPFSFKGTRVKPLDTVVSIHEPNVYGIKPDSFSPERTKLRQRASSAIPVKQKRSRARKQFKNKLECE